MATCNAQELLSEACLSGFTCLSSNSIRLSWAVAIQQLYNLSGETATVQELLNQACASGFSCTEEPIVALAIADQQLCNLTS